MTETKSPKRTDFSDDLVKDYPKSNKKISVEVMTYDLNKAVNSPTLTHTTYFSPHGIEFVTTKAFEEGTLLKINVALPEYWNLKSQFVEYHHVDRPKDFKILARVVSSTDSGKRGRKKLILAETVNIDDKDVMVIEKYLEAKK